MSGHWIGVASREHVRAAVDGGFCQLNHGREAPLRRLRPGDRLVYYSAREGMRAGRAVHAFTAIGEVVDREPHQVRVSETFQPFRRDVRYLDGQDAPIGPLLARLSFSRDTPAWGHALRRGLLAISAEDYRLIAAAMGVADR